MAGVDPVVFATSVIRTCNDIDIVAKYDVQLIDNLVVKIRVYLTTGEFVDIFYNSDTERTAYALIDSCNRIFGVDNTGSWHIHPFDDPDKHIPCNAVSFSEFMKMVQLKINR